MRHRKPQSSKRRFAARVEQLDERTLLTMGPVAPVASVTPATAAPSTVQTIPFTPFVSPALTQGFQTQMARLDQEFIGQAQGLNNLLIARIDHYQAILAGAASSAGVRVERVVGRGSRVRIVRTATISPLINAEIAHQEAFFNTKAARLAIGFQNQVATLSTFSSNQRPVRVTGDGVWRKRTGCRDGI